MLAMVIASAAGELGAALWASPTRPKDEGETMDDARQEEGDRGR